MAPQGIYKMKKVYFACSIRGGGDKSVFGTLVDAIKSRAELLTEIFVADGLRPEGSPLPEKAIWERDIAWVKEADLIIAEVSNPSLGVGYEIAKAEEWDKPVLALYKPQDGKKLSAMIAGSPSVIVVEYLSTEDAEKAIARFIEQRS
jgi:hypothetical protein